MSGHPVPQPKSVEVLCVGHAAYDRCVYVESFPIENSKCETHELVESCGGPAANAAWLLSAWGLATGFAGLVGEDLYGGHIRDEFIAVGTDVSLLELRPGHATPLSTLIVNQENASRTIINRKLPGAFLQLDAPMLAGMSPRFLLHDGHELAASLTAMSLFPDALSVLDAGSWREGTATLAGRVHILAASERFALQATGLKSLRNQEEQRDCIARLRDQFATRTLVTLGERGLIYDDGEGFQSLPAFAAEAVDTTAAGDLFHGALVYALAQQKSWVESLRFASMAASLSVRKKGGRSSAPALTEVEEALALVGGR